MRFLIIFFIFNTFIVNAQEDPWLNYMTPSVIHTELKRYEGNFNLTIIPVVPEGQEKMEFAIESSIEMILGGRFLEIRQKGDMMAMPFEGITLIGYNNASNIYESISYTNFGTGMSILKGKIKTSDKTIELSGEMVNPIDKSIIKNIQIIRFVDQNEFRILSFDQTGLQEKQLTQEYVFRRKK